MPLLRILRNLAVLVILTVGSISLSSRPVAAQSCRPLGAFCNSYTSKCCPGSLCGPRFRCCNKPLNGMACTRSDVCCQGVCYIYPGQSYGRCS
jgi:hypothetical protein